MKAIKYAYFKLEEKATRSVNKNEYSFVNIIRDKFAMTISFCKKLFGCIKYLQLLLSVTKQVTEN